MRLCRFTNGDSRARVGLVDGSVVTDLSASGVERLEALLEDEGAAARVSALQKNSTTLALSNVRLLAPIDRQEVWAAGVTYLRSRTARMEESDFSATAYDKVYEAERPEIFFKSMPEKVVATGEPVGIRRDARWNVPEPELALVMNSRGRIVGHTIGNDMSSRDIEGENLLYLPQAKVYDRSCALGPWIVLGTAEDAARDWQIRLTITRDGQPVFSGETVVKQIKRSFEELAGYLFRCQTFPYGAVLLTGTGIVPPDSFTLRERDSIDIAVSGIGVLSNSVVVV